MDNFIANDVSIHTDDWERQVAPNMRCTLQLCRQLRRMVTFCTFNCWDTNKQTKIWVYVILQRRKESGESNIVVFLRHILFTVNYPGDRQRGGHQ